MRNAGLEGTQAGIKIARKKMKETITDKSQMNYTK